MTDQTTPHAPAVEAGTLRAVVEGITDATHEFTTALAHCLDALNQLAKAAEAQPSAGALDDGAPARPAPEEEPRS